MINKNGKSKLSSFLLLLLVINDNARGKKDGFGFLLQYWPFHFVDSAIS